MVITFKYLLTSSFYFSFITMQIRYLTPNFLFSFMSSLLNLQFTSGQWLSKRPCSNSDIFLTWSECFEGISVLCEIRYERLSYVLEN